MKVIHRKDHALGLSRLRLEMDEEVFDVMAEDYIVLAEPPNDGQIVVAMGGRWGAMLNVLIKVLLAEGMVSPSHLLLALQDAVVRAAAEAGR